MAILKLIDFGFVGGGGSSQIQDARNHVSQAIYLLANRDESYQFKTGAEVLKVTPVVPPPYSKQRQPHVPRLYQKLPFPSHCSRVWPQLLVDNLDCSIRPGFSPQTST